MARLGDLTKVALVRGIISRDVVATEDASTLKFDQSASKAT